MKRVYVITGFILILSLVLLSSPSASARILVPSDGAYMVNGFGSTTAQNSFTLNEQPYVFIEFDKNKLNTLKPLTVKWFWQTGDDEVSDSSVNITSFASSKIQLWNSVSAWDLVKKPGDWVVQSEWVNESLGNKGGFGGQLLQFTVTPEPLSSMLFLLGGAPIAIGIFRRRRTRIRA